MSTINGKPVLTAVAAVTTAIRRGRHDGRTGQCSCTVCSALDNDALEALDFLEQLLSACSPVSPRRSRAPQRGRA
jgi:hypothetical protein